MINGQNLESRETVYRRLMLQKTGELSKKHGGLRKIPANLLEENGIKLEKKGRATTVVIKFPDPDVMEKRLAELQPAEQPIAKEAEPFKLPSEPTPRGVSHRPATMEDFWIEHGWYKVDRNGWRLIRARWREGDAIRRKAIRFLVEQVLKKDPRDVTARDFKSNRLGGLLIDRYSDSPYRAVSEAFPELGIKPWEMVATPRDFFKKKENRIAVVRWLVEKLSKELRETTGDEEAKKDPRDLTKEDLNSNRMRSLREQYSDSPYAAISEAFPELGIKAWEMAVTPMGFYKKKENRVAAVRWLVEKLSKELREATGDEEAKKDPRDVIKGDFFSNRLSGLLNYYSGSPFAAVSEAFPELDIKEWEMAFTPNGFYNEKENRVAAVRWLVEKLGKEPRDLTQEDFNSNRLGGLLFHSYSGSPYAAVAEAFPELDIKPWEIVVTPRGFFDKKENRVAAVRWLVEKLEKNPRDITGDDFDSNRMRSLSVQYSGSPYAAISEAFPELGIKAWEMAVTPMGFYKKKENRVAAVRWLVEKLGKNPKDIVGEDFHSNRLGGLLNKHYSASPYEAMLEAGLVTERDERYMRTRNL